MKKLVLAVMFCFSLGCINVVHADFLGIGRFWEDVKRETTNALQPAEKAIRKAGEDIGREGGKAWEDIKREATNAANSDVGQVVQAAAVGVVTKVALNVVAAGAWEVIEVVANAL